MDTGVRKRVILFSNVCKIDTVLEKRVSSKVLIFVVNSKIKSRTMKLTTEQRSEIISEMASSEAGFNELMRVLLDSFSKQERALFLEEHKGEQGNGFRPRRWRGHGCSFQLRIPRTRSGAFQPIILGILAAQESERALLFHELYARGLSCEDIAEVGRRIYGHHYSKQQMSRLSGACYEEIQEWLACRLTSHYLAVYIDATFCSTRRDGSVSKEAYYTMLGLLPDGSREVLTVVNHPKKGQLHGKWSSKRSRNAAWNKSI